MLDQSDIPLFCEKEINQISFTYQSQRKTKLIADISRDKIILKREICCS